MLSLKKFVLIIPPSGNNNTQDYQGYHVFPTLADQIVILGLQLPNNWGPVLCCQGRKKWDCSCNLAHCWRIKILIWMKSGKVYSLKLGNGRMHFVQRFQMNHYFYMQSFANFVFHASSFSLRIYTTDITIKAKRSTSRYRIIHDISWYCMIV